MHYPVKLINTKSISLYITFIDFKNKCIKRIHSVNLEIQFYIS